MQNKKLIQLAKENKKLKVQLESAKLSAVKAMEQLKLHQEENNKLKSNIIAKEITTPMNESEKEAKELKEKLATAETTINKLRKKKEEAENEVKKYATLLRREVGQSTESVLCNLDIER